MMAPSPEHPAAASLEVALGARAYPIHVGPGLLGQGWVRRHVLSRQVALITNETVEPHYAAALRTELDGLDLLQVVLPDGEQFKNLQSFEQIMGALLERRFSRNCTMVALGGGVVGDLCGFAAACYMRGVRFIQVPTTLLAQVDSSVGGKTAVNHPLGKNMIGAFHQPVAVIADTDTLDTLPQRELAAGVAEVIKYGLIRDARFFAWLEQNVEALMAGDPAVRAHAITESCRNKAAVVAADETEQGQRALLNLGHTFGHAIETAQQYQGLLHGEAVAVGMRMAAEFSRRQGLVDQPVCERTERLLRLAGLPVSPPAGLDAVQLLALMQRDKKAVDGRLRLVLLRALGEAFVCDDVAEPVLRSFLEEAVQWEAA